MGNSTYMDTGKTIDVFFLNRITEGRGMFLRQEENEVTFKLSDIPLQNKIFVIKNVNYGDAIITEHGIN